MMQNTGAIGDEAHVTEGASLMRFRFRQATS